MKYTIENLKLNVEEAKNGRTWLLLPEEYNDPKLAEEYPLPADTEEVQLLSLLPVRHQQRDTGSIYLRRAKRELTARLRGKTRAPINIEAVEAKTEDMGKQFEKRLEGLESKANQAIQRVQDAASKAIASLDDLFRLGREGLEGQMKAHLAQEAWKGEEINARAFRDCFRMVFQAVKGLGLPTAEESKARGAIFEELAASLRATQEATVMNGVGVGEKEH